MIDLIKFELYKIFSKKSVRIVLLLTVLFSAFNAFGESINMKSKGLNSMNDVYSVMKEHEGKVIIQEGILKAENTIEKLKEKEKRGEKLTKEEIVYRYYLYEVMITDPVYMVNNEYYTIDEIKDEISTLENNNKTDTYEYKNLNFVYEKVKNIEESKYYFKSGWISTTDFNVIATLITTLIVVGLATIFSDEYQNNSAQIMLSCKRGKNKLVLSKILTGLIYTVIMFTIVNGTYMLGALKFDFTGWDKPLELFKYYRNTPFDMRVIDFYITGLGVSFIGAMLFSLVTMLVSLLVRNNMISLLLSLGMYYVPTFVSGFIPIDSMARVLREINLAEAVRIEGMFINPSTYNILGNPTLYSTVLISLVVISIPVVIYLIRYFGKRQAI
ncbi:MAG: ABC transporter permease subunit [Peptostreptococcaceae bacterium]|nr:ABC transporter permease subunit [Peptostreptococcaceae bacterium]